MLGFYFILPLFVIALLRVFFLAFPHVDFGSSCVILVHLYSVEDIPDFYIYILLFYLKKMKKGIG